MKLLTPSIPTDFCEVALEDAFIDIDNAGFDIDGILLMISEDEDVEKYVGKKTRFNICVERSYHLPKAAWMLIDLKQRFIYYGEGI